MICTEADPAQDLIFGVALLNGSVSSCSIENCGIRRLTLDEALDRAVNWEQWAAERGLEPDRSKY